MIITRTPYRISFVGGGTDLESFYSEHQGAVISTSINKFIYISSHRFFDRFKFRLKYSQTENCDSIAEIHHPLFREVLGSFPDNGPLEFSSNGDVPSGTGLGSSSAFTVCLLHNMHARNGEYVAKEELAEEACRIEIERLKEPIGKQDHYAAAFGGLNVIRFNTNGSVNVEPLHLNRTADQDLQENLHLFFTGQQRQASGILSGQKRNTRDQDKVLILQKMVNLVWRCRDELYAGDLTGFGETLHENWILKKQLASGISNPEIDAMYERGLAAGALGGKLLGAGGGGFLLFYCEKRKASKLIRAMKPLANLPFRFEREGSKVVFVGDEYEQ